MSVTFGVSEIDLLKPGDADYEGASAPHNRAVPQRPAFVAMAADDEDVMAAVAFARRHGLGVGVQCTGHGITVPADGGVLVNTSRMKTVEIDEAARVARVGAGAIWSDVIPAAHRAGLAPLSGTSPTVGVVGYTLGGGIGWLARRYGYAADSVRAAEVVTADGFLVRASETEHADLFWALRGGTGNFGVVTALEFDLYPVSHVYGGGLYFAIEHLHEVAGLYADRVATLPDTFTTRLAIVHVPSAPFVPEPLRGRWIAAVQGAFIGTAGDGAEWLRPFRDVAPLLADTFTVIPYTSIGTIANEPPHPEAAVVRTEMLRHLRPELVKGLLSVAGTPESTALVAIDIRHLGGALASRPEHASAVGHRDQGFWMNMIATFRDDAGRRQAELEMSRLVLAVQPQVTGLALPNGLNGADGAARVRTAYSPENYQRLRAVKKKYDPENLFRFNRNIPPHEAGGR